jgi:myo-inositol-1(or 4)-monophosphatase
MENLTAFLTFAKTTALEAGAIARSRQEKARITHAKATPKDIVTQVDVEVESFIIKAINSAFPEHAIISEETGHTTGSPDGQYTWLIDPIDGTINYAWGWPLYGINLALRYAGRIILGVTNVPAQGELFYAAQGKGAFLNDKAIHVSAVETLSSAVLSTGFGHIAPASSLADFSEFYNAVKGSLDIRRMGSASVEMAYIACGRLDGYWEHKQSAWDWAPGVMLIQEAGGSISKFTPDGESAEEECSIVATNGLIHTELISQLGLLPGHK